MNILALKTSSVNERKGYSNRPEDLRYIVSLPKCVLKSQGDNQEIVRSVYRCYIQVFSLVQVSLITPYSSKYSRRDYTRHQLLTILLFKEYRKEDYRTVICNLEEMDRIREFLGLTSIPHFTVIQKFLHRIKPIDFDILFKCTLTLFYSADHVIPITAIDSPGFTSGYSS